MLLCEVDRVGSWARAYGPIRQSRCRHRGLRHLVRSRCYASTFTDNYRTRRSRAFWGKGIGNGKTVILLGSLAGELIARTPEFEPTGIVGLGDARAAHELAAYFNRLGVTADIAYANSPLAGQGRSNIVLLGAEEANPLIKGAFDDVASTFRFETSLPMTLHDGLRNTW